jgi:hypothetical protein
MKRISVISTLVLLGLLGTAPVVQAAPASTGFTGSWVGHDPLPPDGDGSTLYLVVKGGTNARIDFQDNWGTVCWDAGAVDLWFSSTLRGTVSGNTMTGVFRSAHCGHLRLTWMKGTTHTWTLNTQGTSDPSDDTLWDGFASYSRA